MRVEVIGSGPPLVLLHGWAMHGGIFAPLADALRERRTLHVVDLPGHGHNRDCGVPLELEACARAVLDAVPDAPWCGWSLGGSIALHAASKQPQRIPALAMLCATPKFVVADDWPQGMPKQVFEGFATGLRDDWRGTIDRFIALEAFGSDRMREELHILRDAVLARGEPAPHVLAEGLHTLEDSDLRDALSGMRVPSLWIAGRRDRLVNPLAMREAARMATDAGFVQIEHAGHAPFLTHADDVAEALLGFLAEQGA
ncbi:pimeloyl-ACP methyl ester esterase BioH [Thermomonas sp. HDW16]|uniref:pimeloyl-ACP methyl ester esterase BioH n=1 Tax=Thermomonas sp. HDW16 TaxID=2714945 RepID=UPI00140BBD26|nr:pimeloyl-ACP methyl ester esterase BioH [Thermomonas sp. HDW16]QIL21660.1 pimeloyl-ACP methyl ester esterase BioH [Thermomonas sp. HDW16]